MTLPNYRSRLDDEADTAERHFETRHLTADLRGRSVRGGAFTFGSQFLRIALQTGATAILARILWPDDYGLIGMVATVAGFIEVIREFGLSTATIQSPEINQRQVSTLFWINVAAGAALMLVAMALAPATAWLFGKPELTAIGLILPIGFLINGLNAQHRALLSRQMRYGVLAVVDVAATVFSLIVSIAFAFRGFHYWSLVAGQLAMAVATTVLTWWASGWRPGLPSRGSGVRPMLTFGVNHSAHLALNYLSRNMDNMVIGLYWGAGPLGLYLKAYQLVLLPLQQVTRPLSAVAMPALARLQNDPIRFRSYYLTAIEMVTACSMPLVAFVFVLADAIVALILGPKWDQVAPIFRILGPAAFFGCFNMAPGWVYTSRGEAGRQLRFGMVNALLTVAAFFIGVRWGAIGVAAAYSIVFCCVTLGPPAIIYAYRGSPLRPRDLPLALWRPALASIAAGALLFVLGLALKAAWGHLPPPAVQCVAGAVAYGLMYLGIWRLLPGGREFMHDFVGAVGELRPRGSGNGGESPGGTGAEVGEAPETGGAPEQTGVKPADTTTPPAGVQSPALAR